MTNDTNEKPLDILEPPDSRLTVSIKVHPAETDIQVSHNGDLQTFTFPRDDVLQMVNFIITSYQKLDEGK